MTNLFKTFVLIYLVCTFGEGKPSTNISKEIVPGDKNATDTLSQTNLNDLQDQDETCWKRFLREIDESNGAINGNNDPRRGSIPFPLFSVLVIGVYEMVRCTANVIEHCLRESGTHVTLVKESQTHNKTTGKPSGLYLPINISADD